MAHFPPNFSVQVCKDGTTFSVQASRAHYCTPRADEGPYTHFEVGFPSVTPPDSWEEFADGSFPADVYGWVPANLVQEFADLHGGLDVVATLNRAAANRAGL